MPRSNSCSRSRSIPSRLHFAVSPVIVVTDAAAAADFVSLGARTIDDPGAGLDTAIARGLEFATRRRSHRRAPRGSSCADCWGTELLSGRRRPVPLARHSRPPCLGSATGGVRCRLACRAPRCRLRGFGWRLAGASPRRWYRCRLRRFRAGATHTAGAGAVAISLREQARPARERRSCRGRASTAGPLSRRYRRLRSWARLRLRVSRMTWRAADRGSARSPRPR